MHTLTVHLILPCMRRLPTNWAAGVALLQCPGTALSRPKLRADPDPYKGLLKVHAGKSRPAFRSSLQRQAGCPLRPASPAARLPGGLLHSGPGSDSMACMSSKPGSVAMRPCPIAELACMLHGLSALLVGPGGVPDPLRAPATIHGPCRRQPFATLCRQNLGFASPVLPCKEHVALH